MRFWPALTRWRGEGEGSDKRDAEERRGVAALSKRDARMAMLLMARRSREDAKERCGVGERGGGAQKVSVYGRFGFRQRIRKGTLDMGVMDGKAPIGDRRMIGAL
ncbi:hypothetical protein MRB53_018659 [Persea americana]|uniref:Uncharacterized protein n=1 Tax=Persea americana TaxID=3435 RepID=A0ACC2M8I3_PERAE|nr:hypothetical protein MRB53_018659 [Persea americana]